MELCLTVYACMYLHMPELPVFQALDVEEGHYGLLQKESGDNHTGLEQTLSLSSGSALGLKLRVKYNVEVRPALLY